MQRAIIHAEGVFLSESGWSKRYHPRRRRVVWFSIIRAKGARRELAGERGGYRIGATRSSLWRRYWK